MTIELKGLVQITREPRGLIQGIIIGLLIGAYLARMLTTYAMPVIYEITTTFPV